MNYDTPKDLFYLLTEAVQVRYKDFPKFGTEHACKAYIKRRDSLYQFIKELEYMYNNSRTYHLELSYTDMKWLEQKISILGIGHQEAHNILDAIYKAEKDDSK